MSDLYDVLVGLAPAHDHEMLDGYRRYAALLETRLSPEQMDDYTAYVQQAGEIRIFEEMTPAEFGDLPPEIHVVATLIAADDNISMENRRVVALLNQRGQHDVAPDLGSPETQERVFAG